MSASLPDAELHIRQLAADDVPAAWGLTVQAGWNQTPADWRRMLDMEPAGCFAAEVEGRLVGTTVCCIFGEVAWLALVLVDLAFRDRGIGRRLVQAGLKYADARGIPTVRLDATPLGRPVYERQGFHGQFELARWGGISAELPAIGAAQVDSFLESDSNEWPELIELDVQATKTAREKFLRRLFTESPPRVARTTEGRVAGYLTRRSGRMATQVGPAMGTLDVVQNLLIHELQQLQGQPVIIDLPVNQPELGEIAQRAGLTVQRNLLRMSRGTPLVEDFDLFQISSGGELG